MQCCGITSGRMAPTRSLDLLRSAYIAIGDPQAGVTLLLELASIAPDPNGVLELLVDVDWIPGKLRDPIYEQIIAHLQDRLRGKDAVPGQYAEESLRSWQARYAMHLVGLQEYEHAAAVLQLHQEPTATELEVRYRIALANKQFDSILEQYRVNPEKAPPAANLRQVANALQAAGQRSSSTQDSGVPVFAGDCGASTELCKHARAWRRFVYRTGIRQARWTCSTALRWLSGSLLKISIRPPLSFRVTDDMPRQSSFFRS